MHLESNPQYNYFKIISKFVWLMIAATSLSSCDKTFLIGLINIGILVWRSHTKSCILVSKWWCQSVRNDHAFFIMHIPYIRSAAAKLKSPFALALFLIWGVAETARTCITLRTTISPPITFKHIIAHWGPQSVSSTMSHIFRRPELLLL